jgi:Sulfotransferase family
VPLDPIFIIGTERSGSNLLRLILNAHSAITVPHPPHIMSYFGPLEKYYGDLDLQRNWARLTKDVVTHVRRHIYPWPSLIDEHALLSIAPPRDLFDLFAAIYEQHRSASKKLRWCCKSTFMIHYTDRIVARYPDARLIWLVRDPRDVVASSRVSIFNPYHPYFTATLWNRQQLLGLKVETQLQPRNLLRVRYEDLIANSEEALSILCQFLGVEFEPNMLRFFETDEAKTSAGLARDWRNTGKPILADNSGRFRKSLSPSEIAIVQFVAGPTMERFGYSLDVQPLRREPSALERLGFRIRNELWRAAAEYRCLREDKIQSRRWLRCGRIFALRVQLQLLPSQSKSSK